MSPKSALSGSSRAALPLAVLLVLLLPAAAARAKETAPLNLELEVHQVYDSNVLYRKDGGESDMHTMIAPRLVYDHQDDRGSWRAKLGLRGRRYYEFSDLNGVDRLLSFEVDRSVTSRLTLFSSGNLDQLEGRDPVLSNDALTLYAGRPDEEGHGLTAGLRYTLDPRTTAKLAGSFTDRAFDTLEIDGTNPESGPLVFFRDYETRGGALSLTRMLSARQALTTQLELSETVYDAEGPSIAEVSFRFLAPTVHWERQWTPLLSSNIKLGVRRLEREQSAAAAFLTEPVFDGDGKFIGTAQVPVSVPGVQESALGTIGGITLTRALPKGKVELSFQRETRPGTEFGESLDVDTLSSKLEWRLTRRTTLRMQASFAKLSSPTQGTVPGTKAAKHELENGSVIYTFYCGSDPKLRAASSPTCAVDDFVRREVRTLGASLDWQMRRNLTSFASYWYVDTDARAERTALSVNNHRGMLGFRYRFPIKRF